MQPDPSIDRSTRGFTLGFLATLVVFLVAVSALVVANLDRLPAPRISASQSFNEKARWLAQRLAVGPEPDVLVAGSSMGVNNIHGPALQSSLAARGVINASSWGLSVSETSLLIDTLLPRVKPRVILLPVYHGDFARGPTKDLEPVEFARLLDGGASVAAYARHLDLWYYGTMLREQAQLRQLGRATYASLDFDATGGVPLACEDFPRSEARWNGFLRDAPVAADFSPAALDALGRLGRLARQRQIVFGVVVCPLRAEAAKILAPEVRAGLWASVRAVVERSGGIFIAAPSAGLTDADFVDYNHLNGCGAEKFTRAVGDILRTRTTRP